MRRIQGCDHQRQSYGEIELPCAHHGCGASVRTAVYVLRVHPPVPSLDDVLSGAVDLSLAMIREVVFARSEVQLDDQERGLFTAFVWDCDEWKRDREQAEKARRGPAALPPALDGDASWSVK